MRREASALLGAQVGHIRLVGVIGEGGMGTVFEGVDDTLQRRVAVKAVRSEFRLDPDARARFLREARILSQLQLPSICAVHDYVQGEDNDFLVLELVEGLDLKAAIRKGLDYPDKLSIAKQLLDVLVAVHGQGVIHRDLKPENVMVTASGEIKVLDFGLARSVTGEPVETHRATLAPASKLADLDEIETIRPGEQGGSAPVRTRAGTVLGTAGYMSPEQARGEPATAASDMYSLGLILQELFTGKAPYDAGLSPGELLARAADGGSRPVEGLAQDVTGLIERLKSVAPGARPSAPDAAEKLARIIDRPRRQRRRSLVAAVWLVLSALAAGMTVHYLRAERAAGLAAREAETARRVSDFMVGLFEVSDPGKARGNTVTAREILDRGVTKIRDELAGQPGVKTRLLDTMGTVYRQLGLYDEAEPLLAESLATRIESLGERDLDVATSHNGLGMLYACQGRFEEAAEHFKKAVAIREAAGDADDPELAHTIGNLAFVLDLQARTDEAETYYLRALEIEKRVLGASHPDVAVTLNNLAQFYWRTGKRDDAEGLTRQALAMLERTHGENDPQVGVACSNLGMMLSELGRPEEAVPLLERAIAIQEKALGADHPDLARTLNNLGMLHLYQQRYEQAQPLLQRTLDVLTHALGEAHPDVATAFHNLGRLGTLQRHFPEAEAAFLKALDIEERTLGPEHPEVAPTLDRYAELLRAMGREGEAAAAEARAASIRAAQSPDRPASVP